MMHIYIYIYTYTPIICTYVYMYVCIRRDWRSSAFLLRGGGHEAQKGVGACGRVPQMHREWRSEKREH